MLVLALTAAATAGAVAAWMADRRRSARRNERGQCGSCGSPWGESGEPFLIHGRLVCEPCAARARRRMPWELGGLAAWAALVAGVSAGNVLAGNLAGVVLIVVVPTIAVPLAVVRSMKRANLRAQERIAAGDYVGLKSSPGEGVAGSRDGSTV